MKTTESHDPPNSGQGGDLGSRVALEAGSGDVIRQSTELLAHVATNLNAVVTSG